jgi:hypothetical protein
VALLGNQSQLFWISGSGAGCSGPAFCAAGADHQGAVLGRPMAWGGPILMGIRTDFIHYGDIMMFLNQFLQGYNIANIC